VKAGLFELRVADSVDEAVGHLADAAGDGKVLAGGQSLAPLMAFRLARPEVLIDLNPVTGLAYLTEDGADLRLGAMTRQRTLEVSALVARACPPLAEALPQVAHVPIRNRGTIGGSVAHADPAAELPLICRTLDARFRARGPAGDREIAAADFFLGPFTTALAEDEVLTEIVLPGLPTGAGTAFCEIARRRGDFAMVAVAAVLTLGADGEITFARLGYGSMGPVPARAAAAEQALLGQPATPDTFRAAAEVAVAELRPGTDIHASAGFRKHLASVLTRRALVTARRRARPTGE
jgi:carbon-monoxide dehydrogenase medium subunit